MVLDFLSLCSTLFILGRFIHCYILLSLQGVPNPPTAIRCALLFPFPSSQHPSVFLFFLISPVWHQVFIFPENVTTVERIEMLVRRNEVIGSLLLPGQREKESGVKKKMVSEQEMKGMGTEKWGEAIDSPTKRWILELWQHKRTHWNIVFYFFF